jgi:hypothetical protein
MVVAGEPVHDAWRHCAWAPTINLAGDDRLELENELTLRERHPGDAALGRS